MRIESARVAASGRNNASSKIAVWHDRNGCGMLGLVLHELLGNPTPSQQVDVSVDGTIGTFTMLHHCGNIVLLGIKEDRRLRVVFFDLGVNCFMQTAIVLDYVDRLQFTRSYAKGLISAAKEHGVLTSTRR